MNKRVMVIAAILVFGLLASLASASQQDTTKDSSMKKDSAQKDSMKKDSMKNDSMQSNTSLSSSDRKFIMEAAHGGMMEVELGRMAVEKASSPDVKQFGQRMVDDHSKANEELMQLASQKGITIPSGNHAMMNNATTGQTTTTDSQSTSMSSQSDSMNKKTSSTDSGNMDRDQKAMMKAHATTDKLSKLSGADFDREYMDMMVKDHTKDVKEFEDASTKAKDADIKAWAAKTLPTLREHLQMARDVNSKVSGKKMSGSK